MGLWTTPTQPMNWTAFASFLNRLESKELAIRRGPLDVTQKQIDILKREIAHLEGILARSKSGGQNA
jgi:hypothetical protein